MARLPKRSAGSLTVHINGEPTTWRFRRISTLERLEQTSELAPIRRQVQERSLVILEASHAVARAQAGLELTPKERETIASMTDAGISPDAARTLYDWLNDLIIEVDGFVDDDGQAVSWATLDETVRYQVLQSLDVIDAITMIDKINDACQIGELEGKKLEPGSKPGDPKTAASIAPTPKKTSTRKRSHSSKTG